MRMQNWEFWYNEITATAETLKNTLFAWLMNSSFSSKNIWKTKEWTIKNDMKTKNEMHSTFRISNKRKKQKF